MLSFILSQFNENIKHLAQKIFYVLYFGKKSVIVALSENDPKIILSAEWI